MNNGYYKEKMTDYYSEKLFNLTNKDEDFLQKLIDDRIEESPNLEYKRELPLKNIELAKDISSFANANGGRIIYGIEEENHKPKKLYPLNPDLKETIENVILSNISPKLSVKIIPIDSIKYEGKKYYVVYVLRSLEGPHMIISGKDYRYYKRVNFSTVPMEDYEIRDMIEKNLKLKQDIASKIKKRKILFFDSYKQQQNKEYVRLVCIPISSYNINLDEIDLKQFEKSGYYMNSLLENHNFVNYKKGKICEYGLLRYRDSNIEDYEKKYLYIDEKGYIEYAHLGIVLENQKFGLQLNDYDVIGKDLIGYVYFIRDFLKKLNILSEVLFFIEINKIKETVLAPTNSYLRSRKHLYLEFKWEDKKYYPSFEIIDNPNGVIRYFADRIFKSYG